MCGVLSPQSFSAKGAQIKLGGDDGLPTFDFIRDLNDLTIFFDDPIILGMRTQNRARGKVSSRLCCLSF